MFDDDADAESFRKGSSTIALETIPPFSEYIFLEQNSRHVAELETLRDKFPKLSSRIQIHKTDANQFLQRWCAEKDWRMDRAVIFLDPYGMNVEWDTIKKIAETKAVDLWILFPLGVGVNRLLTKTPPPEENSRILTSIFGTNEWRNAFYEKPKQTSLLDIDQGPEKTASIEAIGKFFNSRLKSIFHCVAPNPKPLMNSKNNPIFLLCFASATPNGGETAVKIASHILQVR